MPAHAGLLRLPAATWPGAGRIRASTSAHAARATTAQWRTTKRSPSNDPMAGSLRAERPDPAEKAADSTEPRSAETLLRGPGCRDPGGSVLLGGHRGRV